MGSALDLLHALGAETLAGFWVPFLAWTVLALVCLALLHAWGSAHPLVHYAARLALLAALPLGLIAAWTVDLPVWSWEGAAAYGSAAAGRPVPPTGGATDALLQGGGSSPGMAVERWLPFVGSLTILIVIAALGAAAYTIRNGYLLFRMRRQLFTRPAPSAVQAAVANRARLRGIRRTIRAFVTDMEVPPMTFGCRRPVIVIPAAVLEDEDTFHMTVSHELVHIGRYDDLFRKAELLIGSLFAAHPVVARLRRSIAFYRELSCDAAVLAQPEVSRRRYAALLYRFAAADLPELCPSLSMASAPQPELIRRIFAMEHHPYPPQRARSHRKAALLLSATVFAAVTLLVACSDTVAPQPDELTADGQAAGEAIFVIVEDMPEPVGGLSALQAGITYPEAAREAGHEGTVMVQVIIDPEGLVSEASVIEGVASELDEEALRAIRAARFKPGMQGGTPVTTKMVIPVRFALDRSPTVEGFEKQQEGLQVTDVEVSDGVITGRIVAAETEQPLAGANVILEGTTVGTASGPDGRFTLKLNNRAEAKRLVASFVGFASATVDL